MPFGTNDQLDAPPPSPAQPSLGQLATGAGMSGAPGPGNPPIPGMGPGAGPADPNAAPSQPIIQGILDGGVQMGLMLDDFARATPQFAHLVDPVKQTLQAYLGALVGAGAGPTGPTAVGSPFPGGGFGRGPSPQ